MVQVDVQVLGQATAVLVTLAALVTANFDAVTLLAFLGQRLTIAGTSHSGLVEALSTLVCRWVRVIVNGAICEISVFLVNDDLVGWQTSRRRRQAGSHRSLDSSRLGHCVSSDAVYNRNGSGSFGVFDGGSQSGNVGSLVRDRLSASDTVVRVEGTGEQRVRAGSSV